MDRTTILVDVIEYIGTLLEEEKKLQEELRKIEEEDCKKSNAELKCAKLDRLHKDNMSAVTSGLAKMAKDKVEGIEI